MSPQSSAANLLVLPTEGPTQILVPQAATVAALRTAGHTVTVAPVPEHLWDGNTPAPTGFDAVLHFGYYESTEISVAAQTALTAYVAAGGNYFSLGTIAYRAFRGTAAIAMRPLMAIKIPTTGAYPAGGGPIQFQHLYGHAAWTGLSFPVQSFESCRKHGGAVDNDGPWLPTTTSAGGVVPAYAAAELGSSRLVTASFELTCLDTPAVRGLVVRSAEWMLRNTNGVTANDQTVHVNEGQSVTVTYTGNDIRRTPLQFKSFPKPIEAGANSISYTATGFAMTATANTDMTFVQRFAAGNEFGGDEGAVTVVVHNLERPPTAVSRSFTINEDASLSSFQLIAADVDGQNLTYSFPSPPQHGSILGSPPIVTYVPDANWNGTEIFTFRATDTVGLFADGTITINVTPQPDAPLGANSSVTTRGGTPVAVPITATDPDGPTSLTYSVLTNPPQGTLSGTAPTLTYTPPAAFTGLVGFTWRATDGTLNSPTYTVTIDVQPPTTITAQPQTLTATEDADLPLLLNATDTRGRALTYSIVTPLAANTGTLLGTAPSLTYRPPAEWAGSASFRFKACVGTECSDPATISLTTVAVNDPPVAADTSVTTPEDTPTPFTLSGTDVEGSPLTFALVTPPTRGNAVISGTSATYTPAVDAFGTDTFTYRAFDGNAGSLPATVTITVSPRNDAPVAIARTVVAYTNVSTPITPAGADVDNDASTLQYEMTTPPTRGTLTIVAGDWQYRPDLGYSGVDALSFVAIDPGGLRSAPAVVSITVGGGGLPPTATAQTLETPEDSALNVTLAGTDPEGAPLEFELVATPAIGLLNGLGSTWTYLPRPNFNGSDTFTFRVFDGATWSLPADVTIRVTPVNDPPVIIGPGYVTTNEDEERAFTLNVTDVDSANTLLVLNRRPTRGTVTLSTTVARGLTYVPNPNAHGLDSFTLRASDDLATGPEFTVTVNVVPVDDPPVATPQSRTTPEDAPLELVLGGIDPDLGPLTGAIVTPPAHGTLQGTPPDVRYVPALNYNGRDTFTFRVSDGTTASLPATVELDITPVNDAPVVQPRTFTTPEDTPLPLQRIGGGLVATDPENDPLTFTFGIPSSGTVESLGIGLFRYVPPADFSGRVTVLVRANDGLLTSAPASLTIDVTPVNDPPQFVAPLPAPTRTVQDGETLDFSLIARDLDGDTLRFTATTLPDGATFDRSTGRFQWTPAYEQVGTHRMNLKVSDSANASADFALEVIVTIADADRDGVPDAIERRFGTRPDLADSDADGLDDLLELGSFLTPRDSDNDRTFDALDSDSDNDGLLDTNERGPDGREVDTDRDGTPDQRDTDSDDDGVNDRDDNCDRVANASQQDLDTDDLGDACDDDRDGDGVSNTRETGFGSDPDLVDSDGDSIPDPVELGNDGHDSDRDGTLDARELDSDNDGFPDTLEAGDEDSSTAPADSDADGLPDYRDPDSDNDGVPDATDLCRLVTNPEQGDLDLDGEGDACDGDEDGDGVPDRADVCPRIADPLQFDADGDGVGDACTSDDDGDGQPDDADNCPGVSNADQLDLDRDGRGEACDESFDAVAVGGCASAGPVALGGVIALLIRRRRSSRR